MPLSKTSTAARSGYSGMGLVSRLRQSISRAWSRRPNSEASWSMSPLGTPVARCSARWATSASSRASSRSPDAPVIARPSATDSAALDESPDPGGTVDESATRPPGIGDKIGAGVLNVVYLPGKAIVCSAGTLVAGAFMLATFGSAYREATSFFKEGCSGAWLLTAEQVAAVPRKVQFEY